MAVIAVVTSSPSAVEGGHLVVARALVDGLNASGHEGHLVVTPDFGFGRMAASYLATARFDVSHVDGRPVDQVISLRYPSYAVRHRAHVCWLNHTMREYYDLWPRFAASISWRSRLKERARRLAIHAVDRHLLTRHVTRVVAQSHTIRRRVAADFGLDVEVVYPPPPPRPYRCDGYGDYVFAVSRLTPLKRIDLLLRALADPAAARVRTVIAGDGDSRDDLAALTRTLGVADRVTFLGRIDDDTLVDHLARCRAVCFVPFAEDYGFVTVEAFASAKPVVTCSDSGGPAELVRDGETGLTCEPTPSSVGAALGRLAGEASLAERLGANAAAAVRSLTWEAAVKRLVIA